MFQENNRKLSLPIFSGGEVQGILYETEYFKTHLKYWCMNLEDTQFGSVVLNHHFFSSPNSFVFSLSGTEQEITQYCSEFSVYHSKQESTFSNT